MSERKRRPIGRRELLRGVALGSLAVALSGCDRLNRSESFRDLLSLGEDGHEAAQRVMIGRRALAREYSPSEMSPKFRANGNIRPRSTDYQKHRDTDFSDWTLRVDGLVEEPLALSLDDLRSLPQRTQITRHDCVEGWSAIGKWQGPQLGHVLKRAGLKENARYVVFHCADDFGGVPYYESIDLVDAFHPQTILAHRMNDQPLPVQHGAPIRLRVERQLGYKHAKYVMRIEVVNSLADIGEGKGGYWEDQANYEWYAGI